MAHIERIYRYPVKGLSAELLDAIEVGVGEGLPLDRCLALARAETAFDPARPAWLPKRHFLMLARDERLASLRVAYDGGSAHLRIRHDGRDVLDAAVKQVSGTFSLETLDGRGTRVTIRLPVNSGIPRRLQSLKSPHKV